MTQLTRAGLTYGGEPLDSSSDTLGVLRRSDDVAEDRDELHRRMDAYGYLYLPGFLDRDEVLAARRAVLDKLAEADILDERHPVMDGVVKDDANIGFMPELARDNPALDKLLYSGRLMRFYDFYLGGKARHFDYTWFRAKTPGTTTATQPHYDIVFMGRGTRDLFTSWTPLGDVSYAMGGLLVLENSHLLDDLKQSYGETDVDKYCDEGDAADVVARAREEGRELTSAERQAIRWNSTGHYSSDAIGARLELGGRWLTAEFEMGDLLILSMYTMHASSDNRTNQIRLSSDSRYQLASEPVDARWIGEDPPKHGIRAKQGMIC